MNRTVRSAALRCVPLLVLFLLSFAAEPDVFFTPGFPRTRRIFQRNPTAGTITAFVDRREGLDVRWVKVD